jgi:phenylalanyl-tRNA synthetase beta chain
MKISAAILRQFVELPSSGRDLRMLLDDVGIEVKRHDESQGHFTLELLANRGDHHCYQGIAREISGRTGSGICGPSTSSLTVGAHPHPLVLETDLCHLYSATLLTKTDPEGALDKATLAPLDAAEIHSVSPAVDATNLANLEFGQPTHCFDADTITGPITIRLARAGEKAWPLFAEEKVMVPEGAIVIADDEKILAIAGVIGCEESKTTEDTKRILLESAAFDPVSVRKASRALGIHTDSSARFERGSDPNAVLTGAGRVVHLLEAIGWKRSGDTGQVGDWTDPKNTIQLDVKAASTFLNQELTDKETIDRLSRYGFSLSGESGRYTVTIPTHRIWDVEYVADLYEELAKSIGYNDTPQNLPKVDMGALPLHRDSVKQQVEEILLGSGFYEVFTNGFHGTNLRERLGINEGHPLWSHVETTNALDRGYGLVKNNCLAQAVEAITSNVRAGTRPIQMYEWTRTFHPDPTAENKVCTERQLLWAIATDSLETHRWSGRPQHADVWFFKGLVDEIATVLQIPLSIGPVDTSQPLSDCLHPGRQATIRLDGEVVGMLGEVHPRITTAFKLKRKRPIYFEISRSAVEGPKQSTRYKERSVQQPIVRSLAFSLPPQVQAGDIANAMKNSGPNWINSIDIVDLFEHEEDGVAKRAVTFSIVYSNEDGNRSAEEVNQASTGLIGSVEKEYGPQGVTLRA